VGRAALVRRLLAGSLDRAVDVAATLELRGYGLASPGAGLGLARLRFKSRYDGRFYLVSATVLVAAVAGKLLGADRFNAYPTVEIGVGMATAGLSVLIVAAGLAPWRRDG
jgi:energy-coupling factor transport system permease protein